MTQTSENIESAMKNIKEAAEKNPIIQGIHLEGPFISVNYKGAQDASYIQKPDAAVLKHWNELSGNRIKIVTYAPEEADTEFEDWCLSNGIVPSAGSFQCNLRSVVLLQSMSCNPSLQCPERS